MTRLNFYYRKAPYILQMIASLIFLAFACYFTYLINDFFATSGPQNDLSSLHIPLFFILLLALFFMVALYLLSSAGKIVLLSEPAISMDEEAIEIEGKHRFSWSELDYIQYVKRRTTRKTSRGIRGKSSCFPYLKPQHGRRLKVNITYIDEQNHEIFESIHKLAPKLAIKGWKNELP